ncbi:MAG: hypothetical protein JHC46_05670 [Solirubrobacteraceae bacterium]|nr:hypothetical protein [Solirubrobacteraceae bacterium]
MREKRVSNYFVEATTSIITDDLKAGVNGLMNHADGRMYDGKRAFEAATRRAGGVTVGNDSMASVKPPSLIGRDEIGHTIKRSIEELRSGNRDALIRHERTQEGR